MEQLSPTSKKRPFKVFEHSLSQFNDVVIPHRLDMMEKHIGNIEKAIQYGDYRSAIKEQTAANMLVQNLKRDLSEIEALRNQVVVQDLLQFEKAINGSRKKALTALEEYLCLGAKLFPSMRAKITSPISEDGDSLAIDAPQLQHRAIKVSVLDQDEEEYVRSWERLQTDIEGLHSIYGDLHEIIQLQGESIDDIEEKVINSAESVSQGNVHLKKALRYKVTMYPLMGAALGTLVGGPVGLLIGLKAGGCAAIGGAALGFIGGRFLKKGDAGDGKTQQNGVEGPASKPHQS